MRHTTGCAKVYVTDGNQYFNRPDPRLVEIVHPEMFDFGHKGCGWEYLMQEKLAMLL